MLNALADGESVITACEMAGIGKRSYYDWRRDDAEFNADADAAMEQGADRLEAEAMRRALDGSDVLLMFLLKGKRPHIYRDNVKHEHSGSVTFADLHALAGQVVSE